MGDPTLRLHPVKPVTNLQQTTSTSPAQIALTWTASADTSIVGYHVYRATSATGSLTRLTGTTVTTLNPAGSAITGTAYTDTTTTNGTTNGTTYQYMVRAVKLETSNTGTYYNFSQGAFVTNVPPVITTSQSPSGTVGTAFSYQVVASNTPTSFALASGTLPPGVALNTTSGVLSGTPTTVGTYTPAITATNVTGTSPAVVVTITIAIAAPGSLIVSEPFSYTVGANNPDPDAGLNTNNGLPATNSGGTPTGTSTGLRSTWGSSTDVVAGLAYIQGTKTLTTTGGAARVNNATWGTATPLLYQSMTTDPFISLRVGGTTTGNLGLDGTSLYFSLLASTSSSTANSFRFSFRYNGNANFYVSNTATGWSLNGTTATGATLALDTPTLMVLRFDFAAGAATTVSLWVNPPLGSALGAANATVTGVTFPGFSNFQTNAIVADAMTFDELRVGTTFDVVTPFTDSAVAPTDVQSFRSTYGLASNGSQDLLTPAGDGVQNLLKYAFNMLGTGTGQAAALDTPNASVLTADGTAGLPLFGDDAGRLQLTYIRRKASASPAPGVTYAVEFSDALATWAVNEDATATVTDLGTTFERVTVTDSVSAPTKRFVRVRVTTM